MIQKTNKTAIAFAFLWLGFVLSISFMEAWLKFRAPGVTLELGLSIGKLIFAVLNKIEWTFSAIILISILLYKKNPLKGKELLLTLSIVILFVQTVWLLPGLNDRADLHIAASEVSKSYVHVYYIVLEVLKVVFLSIFSISYLRRIN